MRRGTTPTLSFTTPYTADRVVSGYITFQQHRQTVLELSLTDSNATIEDNLITVSLTQSQTLALSSESKCRIQIRALLTGGKAVASNIVETSVGSILKDGEIE